MDCVNENSSGDNESPDDVTRKRKKIANKLEWKSVANRNNRMKGVQYMGMENNNISEKPCRKLGVACSSKYCEKKCRTKLFTIYGVHATRNFWCVLGDVLGPETIVCD